jgi:type IV pilus assembly protein PilW
MNARIARMPIRSRQAGLSLVELMVSITLGLMILSGVLVVFANSSASRAEVERTSRQIENGRYASEVLSDDLRLAGFYGVLTVGNVPAPAALPGDPCSLNVADWAAWIPVHLQGYDNGGFTSVNCTLTNQKAGTDVLIVRRVRTCFAGVSGCDAAVANAPYLQVSRCSTDTRYDDQTQTNSAYRIGLQGTATFNRTLRDCATVANLRQYYVHIYYISTDNGLGDNNTPTLNRLELTGTGWTRVPLVEGIENFQLQYGLDTNGDGNPDVYVADPNNYPVGSCTGACPLTNWMNVVTVQFNVLARNLEASPNYTDAKTYHLGVDVNGASIDVTPSDSYRRHLYTSLVRVVNPAGRRDTP